MLFNWDNKERDRIYVGLIRAQGDILYQLNNKEVKTRRGAKILRDEYDDLERIAKIIQKSFE